MGWKLIALTKFLVLWGFILCLGADFTEARKGMDEIKRQCEWY